MNKRPVIVEWRDSYQTDGKSTWMAQDELGEVMEEDCICQSVGWLVGRDKRFLTLAGMRGDDEFSCFQRIPVGCIISIKKL